jgi:hypothetical protein
MCTENQNLPIVFIHSSYSDYLKYTLAQAKINNPEASIFLIGDKDNDKYSFVEHHQIKKYSSEAGLFSKIYQHHSTSSYNGELFCFKRWFILKEFMAQNKLKQCLYLDSDVLLYADIHEEQEKYHDCIFTLSHSHGQGFNIIGSLTILDEFCDFLLKCFFSRPLRNRLLQTAVQQPWPHGCVSDMVVFHEYQKRTPYKIGDISVVVNKTKHDHNINLSEGFEMEHGIKKVIWIDNKPYCRDIDTGDMIRFNSLHFQGGSKHLIKDFFRGDMRYSEDNKKWFIKNQCLAVPADEEAVSGYEIRARTRERADDIPASDKDPLNIPDTGKCNKDFAGDMANIKELLASANMEEAQKAIGAAIENYPLSPDLLTLYSELQWKSDEREDAKRTLYFITGRWPNHSGAKNTLDVISFYETTPNHAITPTPDSLSGNRKDRKDLENLIIQSDISILNARDLIEAGALHKAKKLLEEVLALNSKDTDALNYLAKIHILEENLAEAEKTLSLILELDPDNYTALTHLEDLEDRENEL